MATAGPNYAGTAANDASHGAQAWTNPTNAQGAPDGSYATQPSTQNKEDTIRLVVAGTPTGTNKSTGASLPTTLQFVSYGGAADLWGTTLTPAQVNASTFGMVYAITDGAITTSNYLKLTNYGFSIPTTATINGVQVEVDVINDVSSTLSTEVDAVRITVTYTPAAAGGGKPHHVIAVGNVNLGYVKNSRVEGGLL